MLYIRCLGILLCIATQLCSINTFMINKNTTVETALRKNILKNYDKILIPTIEDNNLNVDLRLFIERTEVDYEKSQIILITTINTKWIDHRLTWKPDDYEQVEYIAVDYHEIWHPDIIALNNVVPNTNNNPTNINIMVSKNGSVIHLIPAVKFVVHCHTDITHWPYHQSNAVLSLGSWMYSLNKMNMTIYRNGVEVKNTYFEWEITDVFTERHERKFICCPDPFATIEYHIAVRRKVHPYLSIIYVPALCSALFNLITLWLPYDDNYYYYKLMTNLFNAIFIAVNIMIVHIKLPIMTSSTSLIVIYYTYSLGIIVATTVMTMTVKCVCTLNRPLPNEVIQFLRSSYLVYLGVKTNELTTTVNCESENLNTQTHANLDNRRILAKVIDRMFFLVFTFVYLVLLLRCMP